MVNNHVRLRFRTVEGRTNDLMNADIPGEKHIAGFLIFGSERPDIIPFAGLAIFFGKTQDGTIVPDQLLTVLVFALHLAVEYLK